MGKTLGSTLNPIKKKIVMDCFVKHIKQCEKKIKINNKLIIHG